MKILSNYYKYLINHKWEILPLTFLLFLFLYQFIENFLLADWVLLVIRNIDDLAIQTSIHNTQNAIITGSWNRALGTFDYAYGNAFWLLNSILLLPFYFSQTGEIIVILGRQISLISIFASLYLIGLIIERIRPKEAMLKYAILIAIATMPLLSHNTMKYHVNAQCIFLGLLSFYLLLGDRFLSRKKMIWSAIFLGMAIGFKLTAIFIAPIVGLTLIDKLHKQDKENLLKNLTLYCVITLFVAIFCTLPLLFVFPFYTHHIKNCFDAFVLFKNMAEISRENQSAITIIYEVISPYLMSIAAFLTVGILFLVLIIRDLKNKKYISSFIFFQILISITLVSILVNKSSIYIDTYLLSVIVLWPLGLLGATALPISKKVRNITIYIFLLIELLYGYQFRRDEFGQFYDSVKKESIQNQVQALEEMRQLISITPPARILQDINAVFPYTNFYDGITLQLNYGDLQNSGKRDKFDIIVLNKVEFYPYFNSMPIFKEYKGLDGLVGFELEVAIRQKLRNYNEFFDQKYNLIYDKNNLEVYQIKQ